MSLNWDVSQIVDKDNVCYVDGHLNPITHALIFATMFVQLGTITEENVHEFFVRLQLVQLHSPLMIGRGPITFDEVKQHIGLRCNVIDKTLAKFAKHQVEIMKREDK